MPNIEHGVVKTTTPSLFNLVACHRQPCMQQMYGVAADQSHRYAHALNQLSPKQKFRAIEIRARLSGFASVCLSCGTMIRLKKCSCDKVLFCRDNRSLAAKWSDGKRRSQSPAPNVSCRYRVIIERECSQRLISL